MNATTAPATNTSKATIEPAISKASATEDRLVLALAVDPVSSFFVVLAGSIIVVVVVVVVVTLGNRVRDGSRSGSSWAIGRLRATTKTPRKRTMTVFMVGGG